MSFFPVRSLFAIIFLFLFLVVVGWGIGQLKKSLWDGSRVFNIVFRYGENYGHITVRRDLDQIFVLNFPSNLRFPVAFGYGDYPLSKVADLASQEKIAQGILLQESMENLLGVMSDAHIVLVKNDPNKNDGNINVRNLLWQSLFASETNLLNSDLLRLYLYSFTIKSDRIKQFDLSNLAGKKEETIIKDVQITLNEDLVNKFVFQNITDPKVLDLHYSWEIFNATKHDGMASGVGRLVKNAGFDVGGIRQSDTEEAQSSLVVYTQIVDPILARFADKLKIPLKHQPQEGQRADVVLTLGEDYWQRCCKSN